MQLNHYDAVNTALKTTKSLFKQVSTYLYSFYRWLMKTFF